MLPLLNAAGRLQHAAGPWTGSVTATQHAGTSARCHPERHPAVAFRFARCFTSSIRPRLLRRSSTNSPGSTRARPRCSQHIPLEASFQQERLRQHVRARATRRSAAHLREAQPDAAGAHAARPWPHWAWPGPDDPASLTRRRAGGARCVWERLAPRCCCGAAAARPARLHHARSAAAWCSGLAAQRPGRACSSTHACGNAHAHTCMRASRVARVAGGARQPGAQRGCHEPPPLQPC